ncbi:MAG: hypothetical protein R6V12_20250 [Candidatus Hydrogenedentota bacterium]
MLYLLTKLVHLCTTKVGAVIMIAALLLQGYLLIRVGPPELDPLRAKAADKVTDKAAEAVVRSLGDAWSAKYVKVARLTADHNDELRNRLETALHAHANCRIVRDTVFSDIRNQLFAKAARLGILSVPRADAYKTQPITGLNEALVLAQEADADFVIFGAVEEFRRENENAEARVRIRVAEAASAACVFDDVFSASTAASLFADYTANEEGGGFVQTGLKFLGWLLFVMLLPMATASFWRSLLEYESNLVNALCLLFLAGVAALVGWAMFGFGVPSVWETLVLFLGFMMAITWNLFVLNVLEHRRIHQKYAM